MYQYIPKKQQEAILSEYLKGGITIRKLGEKHEVDFRTIYSWLAKFRGIPLKRSKPPSKKAQPSKEAKLPNDVKHLQEELRKAKLYNELLNTMIDIAEDQLKIDIRKKSGTKR